MWSSTADYDTVSGKNELLFTLVCGMEADAYERSSKGKRTAVKVYGSMQSPIFRLD